MAGSDAEKTAAGNLCRAKLSDVCTWVKHSWEGISDEIIFESFKTCEISTSLNESDSDLEITDKDINDDNDINSNDSSSSDDR